MIYNLDFETLEILAEEKKIEVFATDNIKACMYVLEDGTMVSFGYYCGSRTEDHRIIFGVFDEIGRNEWKKLLETTGMIGYTPETNCCFGYPGQIPSLGQQLFIESAGADFLTDQL